MSYTDSNKLLIAILLVAVIVRLLAVFTVFADYYPTDDALDWHMMAQNLLNGHGLIIDEKRVAARTPVPGLYFAAIYSAFGVSVRAVQIANALLGVITVWLVYDLVKRTFGIVSARWSALFVSVYPMLLSYTGQLLSETPVVVLIILALWCVWVLRDRRTIWFAPVGIILGLAVLTRPTALPMAVLIAVWTLVGCFANGWLQRISRPLIMFLFLGLTIAPWTLRNYIMLGKFIPFTSDSGLILWLANNPWADGTMMTTNIPTLLEIHALPEGESGAAYQKLAVQFIEDNPEQFVRLTLRRLLYFWHLGYHGEGFAEITFLVIYLPMLVLALIGARIGWRSNRSATLLLLVVPVSLTAIHMVFIPAGRYRLPAELIVCIFAGVAACWSSSNLLRSKSLREVTGS